MCSAVSKHTSGEGKIFNLKKKHRNYYDYYFLLNLKGLSNCNKSSQKLYSVFITLPELSFIFLFKGFD